MKSFFSYLLACSLFGSLPLLAEEDASTLAKELSNPVASLISVPLQNNWDYHIGPNDATRYSLNVQPVIPIALSSDLNLISRTILPFIDQGAISNQIGSKSGLGDIIQSFFFSPTAPTSGGWIWGAGPVVLLPTATDDFLGSGKWGLGPSAVLLRQSGGWTYGALVNHIWSVGGESDRSAVNATFLQPFLSYTTKTATSFTVNAESTYDWTAHQWTLPLIFQVAQVLKVGGQPISLGLGARYFAEGPQLRPSWGARFSLTFLFPK